MKEGIKEIIRRLSHIWSRTEDGRRVRYDMNVPLSHRSGAPARLRRKRVKWSARDSA